jgi:hypothetical protein
MTDDRLAANRETAEAIVQETILPALTTVRDELHRPEQQVYVTVTLLSPTSAELIIARTATSADDPSNSTVPLRYVLVVAIGSRAIVVKRIVNGKSGSFLGQRSAASLRPQAIVDDVRRVWRRTEKNETGR